MMRIPRLGMLTARIADLKIRAGSSYWLVPSSMTAAAIALALTLVAVDRSAPDWVGELGFIIASQPEGARQLLATVAGSMITVAGVTFSMTLLMVSFASAQLGPRLVPRFLRDRGNQIVLGMFIATFIYCLLVLRTVHSSADASARASAVLPFVPHLAIFVGVCLALLSVGVLIYFLHHVPTRINAGSVIGLLGDELLSRLEGEFPPAAQGRATLDWPCDRADGDKVRLEEGGCYLRIVDYDGLVALAERTDRKFTTMVSPGAFCVPETPIALVHGGPLDETCLRELRGLFSWGGERTLDQDILFLVDQLAEIAGKSLSTGINDQFTALLCIDQMERLLCAAAKRRDPDGVRRVADVGRVFVAHVSLAEVADRFLIPLRQFARGDLIATERLLAMLDSCMRRQSPDSPLAHDLLRHRDAMFADALLAIPAGSQQEWLKSRESKRRASAEPLPDNTLP